MSKTQDYNARIKEVQDAIAILEAQGKERFSAEITVLPGRIFFLGSSSETRPPLIQPANWLKTNPLKKPCSMPVQPEMQQHP